ncbi:regulatory protein MarR [Pseudonocardia dioxanivorans CB1190]|uniref:Regulatory protein MarR n=1 Tax=Pseudonocardia dioxanivorans (strain ATCC 55486 / DSM 44775 / JCM 13855 / CB1190) TaxID=675635 RepID=F4CRI4_PSEUX|nr:MarR family transcriptional regulator [Pseudonocardia dioxanivorans]AEA26192.1 regulatory protein MarR [Pseudonocardia dioxanivorans CB1190]
MTEPQWLDDGESEAWLSFLVMHAKLTAELHRRLRAQAGLSLADFDVLAQLTEAPDGTVRARQLGRSLQWEKSRLSHHLDRMQRRGLIRREDCAEDSRGAMVVVTELGRETIERAAPPHVQAVRELVFDRLTRREVDTMRRISEKILDGLDEEVR